MDKMKVINRANPIFSGKILAVVIFCSALVLFNYFFQPNISTLIVVSLIVLIFSSWMMHRTAAILDIKRVGIVSFWYFTYIIMVYIPSILVYFEKQSPYRDTFLFSVQSVLVTVPLGIYIFNLFSKFKPTEIKVYWESPVYRESLGAHKFIAYLFILIGCLAVTVLYFMHTKVIPLVYLIQHPNQVEALILLREQSFKALDPRWADSGGTKMFYVYLFLRTMIYPFIIIVTLGYYLLSRKLKWLLLFLGTSLIGVFYAASSIARAPVAAIFLRVMVFLYIYKCGKISKRLIVILLILVLLFPVFVTSFGYGSNNGLIDVMQSVFRRMCYTPAWGLYYYFEIFPENHDFVFGQTLAKPFLQFFTKDFFYIENYVYKYMFPTRVVTGHENDAFISNFYADFGLWGVVFGGIIVGFIMQFFQVYFIRSKKTVVNIALFSFMIYAFWVLNSGSLTSVLFVNGVLPVFIFVGIIKCFESVLHIHNQQNNVQLYNNA